MLAHPTLDQLNSLGLHGLAKGFKELEHKPEARSLDHAEWLGLLLEYELTLRRQKQFETRARVAKLRHSASVEDVNYQTPRGLDRALFLKLSACDWIAERRNLLVTGASGLGQELARLRARPQGVPRKHLCPLHPHAPAASPTSPSRMAMRATPGCCAPSPASNCSSSMIGDRRRLRPDQARDLLEIVEDRYDKGSIIITSQVPIDRWHDLIGVPTLADAILDRVIHNAYRIELAGESLRKRPFLVLKSTRARAGWPDPRRGKAVDKAGSATALWRARYARRYPPPPNPPLTTRPSFSAFAGPKSPSA